MIGQVAWFSGLLIYSEELDWNRLSKGVSLGGDWAELCGVHDSSEKLKAKEQKQNSIFRKLQGQVLLTSGTVNIWTDSAFAGVRENHLES